MLICCEQNMDFGRCSETSFQLDCEASFPLNLVHLVKLKSRCPLSSKEKKLKNFVTWCLWCIGNSSISISNLFLTNAAVCGKICTTYMYKPTMAGFKWSETILRYSADFPLQSPVLITEFHEAVYILCSPALMFFHENRSQISRNISYSRFSLRLRKAIQWKLFCVRTTTCYRKETENGKIWLSVKSHPGEIFDIAK